MTMTEQLVIVILLTLVSGLAMPFGALIAKFEHIQSNWLDEELKHGVIAFGGGALFLYRWLHIRGYRHFAL